MALPIDKQAIKIAIDNAKAKIPEIEAEINKAKAAGIDMSDAVGRLNAVKETVNKLNTYYNS